jgi:hypothetical protein
VLEETCQRRKAYRRMTAESASAKREPRLASGTTI